MNFATALLLRKERWLRGDRAIPEPRFFALNEIHDSAFIEKQIIALFVLLFTNRRRPYVYFLEPFQNRDRACQYFHIERIEWKN